MTPQSGLDRPSSSSVDASSSDRHRSNSAAQQAASVRAIESSDVTMPSVSNCVARSS